MKYSLLFILCIFSQSDTLAQIGRLALSPYQTIQQNIGKTDIEIIYSRPAIRDRKIFGGLVPYNQLWRTGANRNTKITFSQDVYIDTILLKKGSYAIFTLPNKDSWDIYFYKSTHHWEVPEDWNPEEVAASIKVTSSKTETKIQSFTISIDNITNDKCTLTIAWENTKISIPINLLTEELMQAAIDDVLNGPDASDYFSASRYRLESGRDMEQALIWINKAIELRENSVWWDYDIKSRVLLHLGQTVKAKEVAEVGLKIAKSSENKYGIKLLKKLLAERWH